MTHEKEILHRLLSVDNTFEYLPNEGEYRGWNFSVYENQPGSFLVEGDNTSLHGPFPLEEACDFIRFRMKEILRETLASALGVAEAMGLELEVTLRREE